MNPIKSLIKTNPKMAVLYQLVIGIMLCVTNVQAQANLEISQSVWNADIDYLKEKIDKQFPDIKDRKNYNLFVSELKGIKQNINYQNPIDRVLDIQEAIAKLSDEGCTIHPFQQGLDNKILPLKTYWFEDKLVVCSATSQYSSLLGQEIAAFDGTPVKEIYRLIAPLIAADNDSYRKYASNFYMQIESYLKHVGIASQDGTVDLTLASGEKVRVEFQSLNEYASLERDLASFRRMGTNTYANRHYWYEYLPNEKTIFLQLLYIHDEKGGVSFKKFVDQISNELAKNEVERLIIDNRYGGGGNGFKLKPLVDLIKLSKVNKKGQLFVLTSRATRGTILELTSILEQNTKAIIVGEPTGEGPNLVSDTKSIELPNSHLKVSVPSILWETTWSCDERNSIVPEIEVNYTLNDYETSKDPWLEKVIQHKNDPDNEISLSEELLTKLPGSYDACGYSFKVENRDNKLYLVKKPGIKSFFSIETQILGSENETALITDINDVYLNYTIHDGSFKLNSIDWKGQVFEIK